MNSNRFTTGLLLNLKEELQKIVNDGLDFSALEEETPSHDMADSAEATGRKEKAALELNIAQDKMKDSQKALARIKAGTYGTCLECGGEISEKRLRALPWAKFCIGCQEVVNSEKVTVTRQPHFA